MKKLIVVLALLAIATTAIRGTPQRPITHNNVSRETLATATATPAPTDEPTATDGPRCEPPAYYDPYMDTCRLPDEVTPEPTTIWDSGDLNDNPFDNDYGDVGWCFDYVDGGTRIIYYPCDEPPTPTPQP